MDAEHSFWAEHRDQTGHGGAGTHGYDNRGNVGELPQQFPAAFGVSLCGQWGRAAERNEERCRTAATQILGEGGRVLGEVCLVTVARPDGPRSKQAIEHKVAGPGTIRCAG